MPFLIDPRAGDFEDDASSTDQRPLLAIAGTMLAELSLIKFAVTWLLVVAMPALVIGLTFPVLSAWLTKVSDRAAAFTGIGSIIVLSLLAAVAWLGLRPLLRLAESNFWSLHSIVVQPFYTLVREGIRHIAELSVFAKSDETSRAKARSFISLLAAALCVALAWIIVVIVWPYTRWDANIGDLASITNWLKPAIANAIVVVTIYFGLFSLTSGLSDALMDQPVRLAVFDEPGVGDKVFRIAHLSDLHVISDPYGFRIESGRAGPQGNTQAERVFEELSRIHEMEPLDFIIISGDVTDAGRSAEWATFLDMVENHPSLLPTLLIAPGNHDLNIVDRANPARLELPMSAWKRLRQMRTISAIAHVQGERVHVFDRKAGKIGGALSQKLEAHRHDIAVFAENGSHRGAYKLAPIWADCFPLVSLPPSPDGVGVLILNSNADANFSFTNALGLVPAEDVIALVAIIKEHPQAKWIIVLHHHLVEYPMRVKQFSERIGTSLINGSWLIRQLKPFSHRVVIMHGHRHIDWIGTCGDLKIVSAPSPVMRKPGGAAGGFLVHSILARQDGSIGLTEPKQVIVGPEGNGASPAATERVGAPM